MSQTFARLLQQQPLIAFHLATALAALVLGIVMMVRRKGSSSHRVLGWTWVALMASTAVASAFIRDFRMPNLHGVTPIHLFTLFVAIQLPMAVWHARRGRIEAHRKTMRGLFFGGCVIAGLFTLLPGRFLGQLLWRQALGLMA
jgi:uncharacterized membrane protein